MANTTIYVLNQDDSINHQRMGDIDSLMMAVDAEKYDYTLEPPPSLNERWYWYNNQWNKEPRI